MTTYVLRNGQMVDKEFGKPMNVGPWEPTMPMVFSDIEAYLSPVDDGYVSGNRAKRDDLKKHDCIDAGDFKGLGGKFKNKTFTKKRGLKLAEEYRDD